MEIRSETIRYSKRKNTLSKTRESATQSKLEELDAKICKDVNLNQHILAEYESLKKVLRELYEQKGRGAIFIHVLPQNSTMRGLCNPFCQILVA